MGDDPRGLFVLRSPRPPQTACERCTQGVMDATNPHLTGTCHCACHGKIAVATTPAAFPGERVYRSHFATCPNAKEHRR